EMTGYDRVMFYRFRDDLSGEVVAESRYAHVNESYLGLRFPASDIPVQARELYVRNRVRYIADVCNNPVMPLMPPLNPVTGQPTDLGDTFLRSVSPVHIQYLRNMGVSASLSVSVIIKGHLWGMLICHHLSGPKYPDTALRMSSSLLSRVMSENIYRRTESLAAKDANIAQQLMIDFATVINNRKPPELRINLASSETPKLLDLIPADGAVFILDGDYLSLGDAIEKVQAMDLIRWVESQMSPEHPVFFTDHLSSLFPPAAAYAHLASGLLVLSVPGEPRDMVLLFRKEMIHTVHWAGKPDGKALLDPDDIRRLTPRQSFASWAESVKGRSIPWERNHTEVAHILRSYLIAERKQLLKKQEVMQIIANTAEPAMVLDDRGIIVFCNASAVRISGFESSSEICGLHMTSLIPETIASGREQKFEGMLNDFCHADRRKMTASGLFFLFSRYGTWLPVYITMEKVSIDLDVYTMLTIKDRSEQIPQRSAINPSLFAENTHLSLVIMDPFGRIEWVNHAFSTLTLFDIEESQGHLPTDLLSGQDTSPDILENFLHGIRQGEKIETEMIGYRKDGQPFWMHILVEPVRAIDEEITHYIASISDISREKNIEQQERGRDRALNLLLKHESIAEIMNSIVSTFATGDGSLVSAGMALDDSGKFLSLMTAHQFPESIADRLAAEFNLDNEGLLATVMRTRQRLIWSQIAPHVSTSPFLACMYDAGFAFLWLEPIVDHESEESLGLLLFARKYSYQPIAAEIRSVNNIANFVALAMIRKDIDHDLFLCKSLIEDSADPMYILDLEKDCRFVFANPSCCRQMECSMQELLSKRFMDIYTEDLNPDIQDILEVIKKGNHLIFQAVYINSMGDPVPVEISANKVVFAESNMIVANFRNISERLEAEQALKESFQQSERLAQTRSLFVANMSHEIRTPMNGIIGLLQLAQNQPLPEQAREYVDKAYLSSMSLLNILNDVLDFSKIQEGGHLINPRSFSMKSLVKTLEIGFKEEALVKDLNFYIQVAPTVPDSLIGDDFRIVQILRNLLTNAFKFTDRGGSVRLNIVDENSTVPQQGRARICFQVEDTGIGIPDDALSQIFEPFRQADDSITRRFGGTGLGLSISRSLLHLMDSDMSVVSTYGKGSRFSFILDLEISGDIENMVEGGSSRAGLLADEMAQLNNSLQPLRILLAEDNEINQLVIFRILELSGIELIMVDNGQKAYETAIASHFDLILMDLHMPVMGGIEATMKLRKDPAGTDIPIIALTADIAESEREKCLVAGMNDYLTKPIRPVELMQCLRRWIPSLSSQ
ncbi:MAG: hypothetical protein RIQ52_323, partial [Pseudomonadota bacterium]